MGDVIMLALQTGNRKSRPERYFCRLLPERGAVDLTVDIELSALGLATQSSTKKQSCIYRLSEESGFSEKSSSEHLPMLTWTFFIHG